MKGPPHRQYCHQVRTRSTVRGTRNSIQYLPSRRLHGARIPRQPVPESRTRDQRDHGECLSYELRSDFPTFCEARCQRWEHTSALPISQVTARLVLESEYQVELHQVPHQPRVKCDQAIRPDRQSPIDEMRYREVDIENNISLLGTSG
jgi:hypothetical protein